MTTKPKEKQMEQDNQSNNKHKTCWTDSEMKTLIQTMTVYFSDLNTYGQTINLGMIFKKYKMFFEDKYSIDQIIFAMHRHCEQSPDFPKVCHIEAILNPKPPRVTEAQYVQAQRWQERNGFPMVSDAQMTIERYEQHNRS